MKPVFKLEKEFFEKKLNIVLPDECWRKDTKIYLNMDKSTLLLSYVVENKEMRIVKNQINKTLSKYSKVSWAEEIANNKERLEMLERTSIDKTKDFIKKINKENSKSSKFNKANKKRILNGQFNMFDYVDDSEALSFKKEQLRISISTGKDSTITSIICEKAFDELNVNSYVYDYFNTSNEAGDTYKYLKRFIRFIESFKKDVHVNIVNPEIGFYPWITKIKDYYIPSVIKRNCCSTYKKGNLKNILEKDKIYIMFLGLRKYESSKRSHYDYDVNESAINAGKKLNVKPNWYRFAPIVEWRDEDVWLYILKNNVDINPMYYKGFNRVGCLICPMQSPTVDLLVQEHYPKQWKRWEDILKINYAKKKVKQIKKWTLDEWLNGKWKAQISKEHVLISKKATPERIQELADLKNVSVELAEKYFVKGCCKCNKKKVNPTEIAMSFKVFGRDQSKVLCKQCFQSTLKITKEDYTDLHMKYLDEECSLF